MDTVSTDFCEQLFFQYRFSSYMTTLIILGNNAYHRIPVWQWTELIIQEAWKR